MTWCPICRQDAPPDGCFESSAMRVDKEGSGMIRAQVKTAPTSAGNTDRGLTSQTVKES